MNPLRNYQQADALYTQALALVDQADKLLWQNVTVDRTGSIPTYMNDGAYQVACLCVGSQLRRTRWMLRKTMNENEGNGNG